VKFVSRFHYFHVTTIWKSDWIQLIGKRLLANDFDFPSSVHALHQQRKATWWKSGENVQI